jgi:hypothetical protein
MTFWYIVAKKTRAGGPFSNATLPARSPRRNSSRCDLVEALAVSLHAERIGGGDAGAVELGGGERELVALARHALLPRALHVEAVALAPAAGERAIDIGVEAELGALRRVRVGRDHVIDQRLDEGRLVGIEIGVGIGRCG